MPISQTEGCLKIPSTVLVTSKKKRFPVLNQKSTQILP